MPEPINSKDIIYLDDCFSFLGFDEGQVPLTLKMQFIELFMVDPIRAIMFMEGGEEMEGIVDSRSGLVQFPEFYRFMEGGVIDEEEYDFKKPYVVIYGILQKLASRR